MVLHQAFRAKCVRKAGIGGEVRHGVTSGVSRETSLNSYVTPHLHREYVLAVPTLGINKNIYIYIYIERERDNHIIHMYMYVCIYIYIYIYIHSLSAHSVDLLVRRPKSYDVNSIIMCYCTIKTIRMLQLRPFRCYS